MNEETTDDATEGGTGRLWVLDRPVTDDGLFRVAVVYGLINVFFATSAYDFQAMSPVGKAVDLTGEFAGGALFVLVIGGAIRWVARGYRSRRSGRSST